jgi:hypothetical protein
MYACGLLPRERKRHAPRLVNRHAGGYTCFVAEKKATGRGTPKLEEQTTAVWRYFFVCTLSLRAFFNGRALAGTASAVPVCFFVPVFQPCHVPALPFGTGKRINRNEGDRMHQSIHATPGQHPSVFFIVRGSEVRHG